MTKRRFDLDPSVAFSLLLEYDEGFANSPVDDGSYLRGFLDDWYADPSLDMGEFARRWVALTPHQREQGRVAT